jgi:hypothetical protein
MTNEEREKEREREREGKLVQKEVVQLLSYEEYKKDSLAPQCM